MNVISTEAELWKEIEKSSQLLQAAFNGWKLAFDRDDLIMQNKWKRLRIKLERKYYWVHREWLKAIKRRTA